MRINPDNNFKLDKEKLIHVGTFSQPAGLKGEIKIIMLTADFNFFKSLSPYFLENENKNLIFKKLIFRNGKIIALLKDCTNRECIEKYRGKKIFAKRINFPKIKKGQYYTKDLVNFEVRNLKNKYLGTIIDIYNFGASDLINIKSSKNKNFFVPMNEQNIVKIDLKKSIIVVDPIEGIID